MFLQPLDPIVLAWLALCLLCTAYVAYDQFRHNPEAVVMKWGFVLVTLYMGPLGLLLYVMADKEPAPGPMKNSSRRSGSRAWARRYIARRATRPASSRSRW